MAGNRKTRKPEHLLSEADRAFREAFELNEIAPATFDHRAHLRLAYVFLVESGREGDIEVAHTRMRNALLGFLTHNGVDITKYHETITRSWILAVRHFMANTGRVTSADDFIDQNPRMLDPKIMLTHYSAATLFSGEARARFVEPDLDPIPRHDSLPGLDGKFVRLEPLVREHHDDLLRAAADGELWRSKVTVVPDRETMAAYIEKALAEQERGKQEPFVIVHKASARIVGTTRYMNIEEAHRRREIGTTWISASVQRTAVNTEAKYLLLRRAFEGHGCIRVEFFTDFLNEQSRAAILRLGAQFEGKLRSHMIMPDGRIRDSMCYSIIAAEWPGVRHRLLASLERGPG